MATYLELFILKSDSDLQDKVSTAIVKKAQALLDGATPSAAEVTWATEALDAPLSKRESALNYVLAANSALTVSAIQSATDVAIQTNVDTAVDVIISGGV